jgi:hypothetical protein
MFDKIVVQPTRTHTEYVPYVKTEIRAPTDESIRLLSEMQEKARENIIFNRIVLDNEFACDVYIDKLPTTFSKRATVRYKINDTTYTVDVKIDSGTTPKDAVKIIHTVLSEDIAGRILYTEKTVSKFASLFD